MFSKASEYGIRAASYIALQSQLGNRKSVKEIAEVINSPFAFTAKILQVLVKSDVISSVKGPGGGYEVSPKQFDEINVKMIVKAIDGLEVFSACVLGMNKCDSRKPCPAHENYIKVRKELYNMAENTYLKDIISGINSGKTYLNR